MQQSSEKQDVTKTGVALPACFCSSVQRRQSLAPKSPIFTGRDTPVACPHVSPPRLVGLGKEGEETGEWLLVITFDDPCFCGWMHTRGVNTVLEGLGAMPS